VRLELVQGLPAEQQYSLVVHTREREIEKRRRGLYQAVQFYLPGVDAPCEIVVYGIEANRVRGYLSTPKWKDVPPPVAAPTPAPAAEPVTFRKVADVPASERARAAELLQSISGRSGAQSVKLPEMAEIEIGKRLAEELERQAQVLDDPVVAEYVNRIGQNVVRNSEVRFPITIKVVNSEVLEVVTLPGGFLYVSAALVPALDSEAQLAGLLGHCLGHLEARHHARHRLERVPSLERFWSIALSEAEEAEADQLGLTYLYKAGYDPGGYASAWERLTGVLKQRRERAAVRYLSHLAIGERAVKVQQLTEALLALKPEYLVTTEEFRQMQQRLARWK
jgi:predicted Zn-dependent protease